MVPRPLHSGHVEKVVPGAPPDPLQVGHTSGSVRVTGTRPPRAATRNGIETAVSISSSSSARGPPPRRPKIDENRSPSPPNERSEEHTSELQSPDTISYAVFCLKKKITSSSFVGVVSQRSLCDETDFIRLGVRPSREAISHQRPPHRLPAPAFSADPPADPDISNVSDTIYQRDALPI